MHRSLALPDTSTVVVAENSRLLLTKMEYDPQSQSRLMLLHLVVGKARDSRTGRHHPGPSTPAELRHLHADGRSR